MKNIRGAQSSPYLIPAGGSIDVPASGEFVRCLEANAQFKLSVSGGAAMYFDKGIQWTARSPDYFDGFTILNPTGAPLSVTMAWGYGELVDSRLALSGGTIQVDNIPAGILNVQDAVGQANTLLVRTKVDEVRAIVNSLFLAQTSRVQNRPLKNGRTLLEGNSYAAVNNANTTIVTAAANTNGVIIHHVDLSSEGTSGAAALLINGNIFMRTISGNSAIMGKSQRDIFVPAGWSIAANCGALGYVSMFYEVL